MTTPTFEDRVMDAIVQRFFEPGTTFTSTGQITDQYGVQHQQYQPIATKAPLQVVAESIFATRQTEIMAALLERVTLDQIVDSLVPKIVTNVVEQLTAKDSYSGWDKPGQAAREKMTKAVWDHVAAEFGKSAVAYLQQTGGLTPVLTATVED